MLYIWELGVGCVSPIADSLQVRLHISISSTYQLHPPNSRTLDRDCSRPPQYFPTRTCCTFATYCGLTNTIPCMGQELAFPSFGLIRSDNIGPYFANRRHNGSSKSRKRSNLSSHLAALGMRGTSIGTPIPPAMWRAGLA